MRIAKPAAFVERLPQATMLTAKRLVTAADADQATAKLVQLMPEEWRHSSVRPTDFEGLRTRDDCKLLLEAITRAVPLTLLLEHGPHSLPSKSDKSHLQAAHFYLSTPIERLGAFVSHRWAADPPQTANALMLHAKIRFTALFLPLVYVFWCGVLLLFPPFVVFFPLTSFLGVLVFKSRGLLRLLGHDRPTLWYDKASVHQTEHCLTQAGLHLFDYYLQRSDELVILFQPEYLSRVWCVYELAWWLAHKPAGRIVLVPLRTNDELLRLALKLWPAMVTFFGAVAGFCLGSAHFFLRTGSLGVDDAFQDNLMRAFIFMMLLGTIAVGGIGIYAIVAPARAQRLQTAALLRAFEVRKTQAWSEADKHFVLGEIRRWCMACFSLGPLIAFGRVEPLGWPTMVADMTELVAPDECVLAASPTGFCNASSGAGHHLIVLDAPCLDNEVLDAPDGDGCFLSWSMGPAMGFGLVYLVLLLWVLGTGWCALRMGSGVTGEARRTHRVGPQ